MNQHLLHLKKQYKDKITPIKMTPEQMKLYLTANLDAEAYNFCDIEQSHYLIELKNAYNCINNKNGIPQEKLLMEIFYIPFNDRSESFYAEAISNRLIDEGEKLIVFYEMLTGYIASRSRTLTAQLRILEGIEKDDYDDETMIFYDYCMLLDRHKELLIT